MTLEESTVMTYDQRLADARERFSLPGLSFEAGPDGVPFAHLSNSHGRASIAFHGATILGYQPANEAAVLYLSEDAVFQEGKAIRGGVPICFPWFGPHAQDASAPAHGLVRTRCWDLIEAGSSNGALFIRFGIRVGALEATFEMTLGPRLGMVLTVHHAEAAGDPERFESALHAYFAVSDIQEISITGLEQTDYLDKLQQGERFCQGDDPIRFAGEVDRVYIDTSAACLLHDPALDRTVIVEKDGSRSTVVWNPWIDKAASLGDLPDDAWERFVCIESGNLVDNAVTLRPGEHHRMSCAIYVQRSES
ncbi:D-hexose-6-phosphate mutarotase [Mucisphaera sp.]|uniref:D-hexose-6-phosphate mutarotase n=1 Tax=Mucisphaera sp. TaxID=2913024 RepID=UPI003D0AA54E